MLGLNLSSIRLGRRAPLDLDRVTTAAAAYSVRKIRVSYTGPCMRVRRSSDNSEADIGFSGVDLDETALLAFVGAGNGFVTTWYDQSGNGFNATQATTANQPRIVTSGSVLKQGGRPAPTYDGTDDSLSLSGGALSIFQNVPGGTIVVTSQAANTGAMQSIVNFSRNSVATSTRFGMQKNVSNNHQATVRPAEADGGGFPTGGADVANTMGVVSAVTTTTTPVATLRKNGTLVSSTVTTGMTPGNFVNSASLAARIGAQATTAVNFTNGSISEVFMYGRALSDSDCLLLERSAGAYYGISVA